jgi:integrase
MALTDLKIRQAKPQEKDYKLTDASGLYLFIKASGSKLWRFKYSFQGKEKLLSFGSYPELKLSEARDLADQTRKHLKQGIDPGALKKLMRATRTGSDNAFKSIAIEWLAKRTPSWCEKHAIKTRWMLEKNLFPDLGSLPVEQISAADLLMVLDALEKRGAFDTAKRARQVAGQVFRYAIVTQRAKYDPSRDLADALTKVKKTHFAAITEPKEVGPLLAALDGYHGTPTVCAALQLAPLTFVRPGELRKARWSEIDFDQALWSIPGTGMKAGRAHIVPLCRQALVILKRMYQLTASSSEFVFPGARSTKRPMSDNAVLAAMRRMGIEKEEMCGHGFRAMARTILDEVLNYRVDWIDHQLAHAVKDVNGRAYNRTAHLEGRRQMMQGWADYLDSLRTITRYLGAPSSRLIGFESTTSAVSV